jgi:hypothetical protein
MNEHQTSYIDEKLGRFRAETRLWMLALIVVGQLDISLPKEATITALTAIGLKLAVAVFSRG